MSHRHRPDLVIRSGDGETIILDPRAGTVHHLNFTASQIWKECSRKQSAEAIATCLAATFDDVPDTVLEDVLATLADFRRLGLLANAETWTAPTAAGLTPMAVQE